MSDPTGISGAMKGVIGAIGAAAVATMAFLFSNDARMLMLLVIGIVVVIVVLLLYKAFLGWRRKRQAAKMQNRIGEVMRERPRGITDAASIARMDDLAKKFNDGVGKFRAAGKDLYSLPWYLLVGEPGSGKTYMMQHCNVGFPPGLQDELQGAGGTVNMHWWFTNHAIVLDTAGRMMFEEVSPGDTSEWKEFLKLLVMNRPNCPINGLLLAIPAESLIKDGIDEISRKAGKIAQQLDVIQRTLGVRFPVFIAITKADLINGFREFFDNLNDPQLQHQIMGWSNPAELDAPFKADEVERHLETVRHRLAKRRSALLLDPVARENPDARRLDEVDALYTFPDSLIKVAPRLRRYLETIFVAGEWSSKPLFLRGIYFTSSVSEGAALDQELAELLRVPVESLPGGAAFQKDKAYFLRDLFTEKIFKEKGLVTRADNTKKLQKRRKAAVLGSIIAAVLAGCGFTWFGADQLKQSIGAPRADALRILTDMKERPDEFAVLRRTNPGSKGAPAFAYNGPLPVRLSKTSTLKELVTRPPDEKIDVPLIFKPVALTRTTLDGERRDAFCALYEKTVVVPLVEAARAKMAEETPETWNADPDPRAGESKQLSTDVLIELMRLEVAAAAGKGKKFDPPKLDLFFHYVLKSTDRATIRAGDGERYQEAAEWVYRDDGGKKTWPPESLGVGTAKGPHQEAVNKGVAAFNAHMNTGAKENVAVKTVKSLQVSLRAYEDAERAVLEVPHRPDNFITGGATINEQYANRMKNWDLRTKELRDASEKVRATIEAVRKAQGGEWPRRKKLAAIYAESLDVAAVEAGARYQKLLDVVVLPESGKSKRLEDVRAMLLTGKADATKPPQTQAAMGTAMSDEWDDAYLVEATGLDDKGLRRFELYVQAYEAAGKAMKVAVPPKTEGSEGDVIAAAAVAVGRLKADLYPDTSELRLYTKRLEASSGSEKDVILERAKHLRAIADLGNTYHRYELLNRALRADPLQVEEIRAWISINDQAKQRNWKMPADVPATMIRTGAEFDVQFQPETAIKIVGDYVALATALKLTPQADASMTVLGLDDLQKRYKGSLAAYRGYAEAYVDYWTTGVGGRLSIQLTKWPQVSTEFKTVAAADVNSALRKLGEKMLFALTSARQTMVAIDTLPDSGSTLTSTYESSIAGLRKGIERAKDPEFTETTKRYLQNWLRNPEPARARLEILEYQPKDFLDDYVHAKPGDDGFTGQYWNELTVRMCQLLAGECRTLADESWKSFKENYARFPLTTPQKNQRPLDARQVREAAQLLAAVRPPVVKDAVKIGQGARVAYTRVATQVEQIRGLDIKGAEVEWLGKLNELIAQLPRETDAVKITLLDAKRQGELIQQLRARARPGQVYGAMGAVWHSLALTVGPIRKTLSTNPGPQAIDIADNISAASGDNMLLEFYVGLHDAANKANRQSILAIDGPWAAVRMIHDGDARRIEAEPKKWELIVTAPNGPNNTLVIGLGLEFPKELPRAADWPQRPVPPVAGGGNGP